MSVKSNKLPKLQKFDTVYIINNRMSVIIQVQSIVAMRRPLIEGRDGV